MPYAACAIQILFHAVTFLLHANMNDIQNIVDLQCFRTNDSSILLKQKKEINRRGINKPTRQYQWNLHSGTKSAVQKDQSEKTKVVTNRICIFRINLTQHKITEKEILSSFGKMAKCKCMLCDRKQEERSELRSLHAFMLALKMCRQNVTLPCIDIVRRKILFAFYVDTVANDKY